MSKFRKSLHRIQDSIFSGIHNNNLVYNTCWEDPRCDRELLEIKPDSKIVMITSAGCNALDYLLDNPTSIECVDVNSKQNALLELKQVIIRHTDHSLLFQYFGEGRHPEAAHIYHIHLRHHLSNEAKFFWDKKISYFGRPEPKKSFYYRGTSGSIAWLFRKYLKFRPKRKLLVESLLAAKTLERQGEIYQKLKPKFLTYSMKWLMGRHITLAMVGVPRPQRDLINQTEGGFSEFIESSLDRVFTQLPITDNYFWTVYMKGCYTSSCCPNYLLQENFDTLKNRVANIHTHTMTISQFLKENPNKYSHYVLLDHQDWLAAHDIEALNEEWDLILKNSKKGTRILLRSAAPQITFFPDFLEGKIKWEEEKTTHTHLQDRVGTYGSVYLGVVQ